MLRISSKKGLFNDVKKGEYRIHLRILNKALAKVRVGDRVQLYFNRHHACDVYVSAIRRYNSLSSLLNMEQWKQLTPEMRTEQQSHRTLRRQYGKVSTGFIVLEYQLVAAPPQTATT